MESAERNALEREVRLHQARVEELMESLRDLEENLQQVLDAPEQLVREVRALKLELGGRQAALAVGAARLRMLS